MNCLKFVYRNCLSCLFIYPLAAGVCSYLAFARTIGFAVRSPAEYLLFMFLSHFVRTICLIRFAHSSVRS